MRLLDFGDCPYLPERRWMSMALQVFEATPEEIEGLVFSGFRRLGHLFYTPFCEGCEACISLRIPAATYTPNKNQRKIWKRNQDLRLEVSELTYSEELFELYRRYQQDRWSKQQPVTSHDFRDIYVQQPGLGLVFRYYLEDRLVGADFLDATPKGLSSVYFVWDCEPRRSLGIFSVMKALEWCKENGREHLYLGLYVEGNDVMRYKASFHPHQRRYRGQNWMDEPSTGWPTPGANP